MGRTEGLSRTIRDETGRNPDRAEPGGQPIQLLGNNFTHVTKVMFGGYAARSLPVASSHTIYVTSPPHKPMRVPIRVFTDHGISPSSQGCCTYIAAPTLTSVSPSSGPATGGQPADDHRHRLPVRVAGELRLAARHGDPGDVTDLAHRGRAAADDHRPGHERRRPALTAGNRVNVNSVGRCGQDGGHGI